MNQPNQQNQPLPNLGRVLVVDDEPEFADMMVEFLNLKGYQAEAAYGGQAGLAAFQKGDFKVVLTDLQMPDMDGMELTAAIKAADSRVLVIMVTGYGSIEKAVTAIKKGAYDLITKPIEFKSLEIKMAQAMERHRMFKRLGLFRGLALGLIISVPIWLILGIFLARMFF